MESNRGAPKRFTRLLIEPIDDAYFSRTDDNVFVSATDGDITQNRRTLEIEIKQIVRFDLVIPNELSITAQSNQGVGIKVGTWTARSIGPALDAWDRRRISTCPIGDATVCIDCWWEP